MLLSPNQIFVTYLSWGKGGGLFSGWLNFFKGTFLLGQWGVEGLVTACLTFFQLSCIKETIYRNVSKTKGNHQSVNPLGQQEQDAVPTSKFKGTKETKQLIDLKERGPYDRSCDHWERNVAHLEWTWRKKKRVNNYTDFALFLYSDVLLLLPIDETQPEARRQRSLLIQFMEVNLLWRNARWQSAESRDVHHSPF